MRPSALIACEESGAVRDALREQGVQAWSCDLKPGRGKYPQYHYERDVRDLLDWEWDMMIAFPDCTYLTCSAEWAYGDGPYHMKLEPDTLTGAARRAARQEALDFVRLLLDAPIPRIALENPVGRIGTAIRPASQSIQPYDFGDDASKRTCLWLKNLPLLKPTTRCPGRWVKWKGKMVERWSNQTDSGQNRLGPSKTRGAERAVTYPGIAQAMAEQWGRLLISPR